MQSHPQAAAKAEEEAKQEEAAKEAAAKEAAASRLAARRVADPEEEARSRRHAPPGLAALCQARPSEMS